MPGGILAIDQGTTSSRAIVHDFRGRVVASSQLEFDQHYPHGGWVEHDPEDLWQSTLRVAREALGQADREGVDVVALGITNQRETTVVWDTRSGEAIHNAIVWQDRRTAEYCARLKSEGYEAQVTERSGLLLDPYFSATKVAWILDNVPGARDKATAGRLAFGTVDSWLIWRLTGGRVHATDATNASRTMLFNIHEQRWDDELLALFDVPRSMLPTVLDSADDFGSADSGYIGRALPIRGVAGDQHAAVVGQTCFTPGMIKSTYGTGCFALMNTGPTPVTSHNRLLTTMAYRLAGQPTYALEGSIFVAGATIKWLRDDLGMLESATDSEEYARRADPDDDVYLVPAFTGLGAPYWDPDARGAIFGLTRKTGVPELTRAALEAVCYQTHDLVVAMAADANTPVRELRVDGGMVPNNWLLQRLADLVGVSVERPRDTETTALGASYLAGLGHGVWGSLEEVRGQWALEARFEPSITNEERDRRLAGWHRAVRHVTDSG
ncbi:glycerol kinase GlpK [Halofilum ochraceum]|uniref:glycerol kinase GlpK n=1 Tax=Halofilum ochraceum TaxID=1611323 RepID=UPI0008DA9412|nr:glycerol kinase GlpK [Halofilum ochraceum]